MNNHNIYLSAYNDHRYIYIFRIDILQQAIHSFLRLKLFPNRAITRSNC